MINNYVIGVQCFTKLDTLKKLLNSLENCIGISKYTLIFYIDSTKNMPFVSVEHWHNLNKDTLDFINKYSIIKQNIYNKILIFNSDINVGPYKGCKNLIDICINYSDYVIFTEDDSIVSIDYLLFYEKIFDQYIKNNNDIVGGSATSFIPICDEQHINQWLDIQKIKWINCTEFSITKNSWKHFGYLRGESIGDIKFAEFIKNDNKYCTLFPAVSRMCKIGFNHINSFSYYNNGKLPEEEYCYLKTNNIYIDSNNYKLNLK